METVNGIMQEAYAQAQAVREDPKLERTYREKRAGEILAAAQGRAVDLAGANLRNAAAGVERAEQAYRTARRAQSDGLDYSRLSVAQAEARATAAAAQSWDTVLHQIGELRDVGDYHALRAWGIVGITELERRLGARAAGDPLLQNAARVTDVRAAIEAAIADLEPQSVKKAQADLDQANQSLQAVRYEISGAAFKTNVKMPGQGNALRDLLSAQQRGQVTITRTDSGVVIEGAGGIFG